MDAPSLFLEEQRFCRNPWALFAVFAGGAGILIGGAAIAKAGPEAVLAPANLFGFAVGVSVLLLLLLARLRIEVRPDALHVRFRPFVRERRFAWNEIESVGARSYRPIRDYGGWGVRFGRTGKAYNVYGNRGVQIGFRDGRTLLLGSQRADELAAVIESVRGASG